jgi:16S rRNA (guanine527-N7)-methyltransferase
MQVLKNKMLDQADFLHRTLLDNHYSLSTDKEKRLLQYLELLIQWNKVFNLTSIRDPQKMIILHLLDSLAIHPYLHGNRIIDVGTGGGLPGIPLAILHPEKSFVLLDSNSKKTRFLVQVIHELQLTNVEITHSRCEDLHPEQLFDSILSRAFASLQVMLEATQHLGNKQCQFLAMKGIYPEQEIQELSQEFKVLAVHQLVIKGLNAERHLVCLAKEDSWEKR